MIIFRNILFLAYFILSTSFLTNNQIRSISKILEYNKIYESELSPKHWNTLDKLYLHKCNTTFSSIVYQSKIILFNHSLPYVHSKYKLFEKSSVVSQHLSYNDKQILLRYGYMGLWKAIKNYNGSSNFYKYSNIYVSSELKRGLSDIKSNFILPHRLRVNKEFMKNQNMSNFYVTSFSHIDTNYDKSLQSKLNNQCKLEIPQTMYEILQMLTPKERNYFTYRYNTYTCEIQRTNKEVAELMYVSEETARKEIKRVTKMLVGLLQNLN